MQGRIQKIGKEGAEWGQVRAARGARGILPQKILKSEPSKTAIFVALLDH